MARHRIITTLNAEWDRLRCEAVPDRWRLAGVATLDHVLQAVRSSPDESLGRLIAAQASGDSLAGRVVLQAMLGKLILMAARDAAHSIDDYVTECWVRIGTYPLQRRPRRIAANLAWDTRRAVRADASAELPSDLTVMPHVPSAEPTVSSVLSAAVDSGLIDAGTARCLYAVYGLGLPSHEAGQRLRISPALVRWRNAKAIRRLAPHAGQLVAA